jgi:hypothetical protein
VLNTDGATDWSSWIVIILGLLFLIVIQIYG